MALALHCLDFGEDDQYALEAASYMDQPHHAHITSHFQTELVLHHGNVENFDSPHPMDAPSQPPTGLHLGEVLAFAAGFHSRATAMTEEPESPLTPHSMVGPFSDQSYIPSLSSSPEPTTMDIPSNPGNSPQSPSHLSPQDFFVPGDQDVQDVPSPQDGLEPISDLLLAWLERVPLPPSLKGKGARRGAAEYKCLWDNCTKRIKRRDHAKAHVAAHFNLKPHSCEHCPRAFLRRADLRRHVRSSHIHG